MLSLSGESRRTETLRFPQVCFHKLAIIRYNRLFHRKCSPPPLTTLVCLSETNFSSFYLFSCFAVATIEDMEVFSLLLNIAQGGIFKKLALYLVLLKLTVLKLRKLDSYKYSTNFGLGGWIKVRILKISVLLGLVTSSHHRWYNNTGARVLFWFWHVLTNGGSKATLNSYHVTKTAEEEHLPFLFGPWTENAKTLPSNNKVLFCQQLSFLSVKATLWFVGWTLEYKAAVRNLCFTDTLKCK